MKKLIAANWKMNKTAKEAAKFLDELLKLARIDDKVEILICPPFTCLHALTKDLRGKIKLGAQNMNMHNSGAYTGEISPLMLKEHGCEYIILGHSERREFFFEDDAMINQKVISALKHGLIPILCVGEQLKERESGKAHEIVKSQLKNCLENIPGSEASKIVVAYEPVWAISRGNSKVKPATSDDAQEMHKLIRETLDTIYDKNFGRRIRIIYGGSMKPENSIELLGMPDIDGGLVGNASLDAKSFSEIIKPATTNKIQ